MCVDRNAAACYIAKLIWKRAIFDAVFAACYLAIFTLFLFTAEGIGGSKAANPAMAPIMVLGRGLPPPQAAEEIVKGWIMEISRFIRSLHLQLA